MKIRVLGCGGGQTDSMRTVSLLIDGKILIDGGSVAGALTLEEQKKITHVIVSHVHMDHIKELPLFFLNNLSPARKIPLLGVNRVLSSIKKNVFNNRIWPDFSEIPSQKTPVFKYKPIRIWEKVKVDKYTVIPIPVHHSVFSTGFIIKRGTKTFCYSSDTGPTATLWEHAKKQKIDCLFVETTYPNKMKVLAEESGHLTPSLLSVELEKLDMPDIPVYAYHFQPAYAEQIAKELKTSCSKVKILEQDKVYTI